MSMKSIFIVVAEDDDDDDRELIRDAAEAAAVNIPMFYVQDGEELLDFLHNRNGYTDSRRFPTPSLVLLDLNMPKIDGRKALAEIKKAPALKKIPVVILSTSGAEEDVARAYETGASSFIVKPSSFDQLITIMRNIKHYWFETILLP